VVIEVKAFGINHAEMHMRKREWAEIADVSGIECVGVVKSCPGGEFAPRSNVAALIGGLGRTINGSYAENTRAPVTNVAVIESGLPWAELAAIPVMSSFASSFDFGTVFFVRTSGEFIRARVPLSIRFYLARPDTRFPTMYRQNTVIFCSDLGLFSSDCNAV
jgi:hypothetical protein